MVKKIQINISNKSFYTFVVAIVLIALGVVVYAQSLPNPGHTAAQIQPPSGCLAGEVLSWTGTAWDCINVTTPTVDEEVPKTFVGATSQGYTGSGVGGYAGGDDKCEAEFGAGARMTVAADFVNGLPNVAGRYNTFVNDYHTSTETTNECQGWTSSGSLEFSPYWSTTINGPSYTICNFQIPILCSR